MLRRQQAERHQFEALPIVAIGRYYALDFSDLEFRAMEQAAKPIGVVQGATSEVIQAMFRDLAERWGATARIAGVIEEDGDMNAGNCGAAMLRSLGDGSRYQIFQDLGPGSLACNLDSSGVAAASAAVTRDIAAGCDLVLLNKFAKLEVARQGLMSAFAAAIEAGVPILTAVSPKFQDAWARFAEPMFVVLPPDAEAIDAWWRAVSGRKAAA
jgi:hypothetical protein